MVFNIRVYQVAFSPYFGGRCRFSPTCSNYALEAFQRKGFFRASKQVVMRLFRCHPFGTYGFDPVTEKGNKNGK